MDETKLMERTRERVEKEREDARRRKQKQRQREREAKGLPPKEGHASFSEFWEANRGKERNLAALEQRHDETWLLFECMRDYLTHSLAETKTTEQDLADTVREVQEHVKANGTTLLEVTLVEFFREDEQPFYNRVQAKKDATSVFARTGLLQALPSGHVREFLKRFAPQQPAPVVERFCAGCGKKTVGAAHSADVYCDRCTELRHERAQVELVKIRGVQKNIKACDQIFDAHGRVKD